METRQVKAALKAMPIKTDRRDAEGIARLLQMGWFRPVHCKSVSSQEMRALLTSRKSVQDALTNLELSLRGVLRNFGLKLGQVSKGRYEARVRELTAGNAMLEAAAEPILRVRADLRRELAGLEKLVRKSGQAGPGVPPVDDHAGRRRGHSLDLHIRDRRPGAVPEIEGCRPLGGADAETGPIRRTGYCRPDHEGRRCRSARGALPSRTVMLNHAGPDWLKAWAQRLTKLRGKKRATVALARRIGVVLHRMWRDGTEFRFTREEAMALRTA